MDKENENKEESTNKIGGQECRRLERDSKNGVIGGVLAGVADYAHIDTVVLRLIFVFLFLFGGPFVILMGIYFLAWIFLPQKREQVASSSPTEDVHLDSNPLTDDSPLLKVVKFGCLGIGGALAFVILIFALLLVVPSIYLSDFIRIFSDPMIGTFDHISFDVNYQPDIPFLVIGALVVFVMPICYLVLRMRKSEEERAAEGRSLFWVLLLVWVAGIFMIISSLTNNREDFERSDVDYSFFNVNFEQDKI